MSVGVTITTTGLDRLATKFTNRLNFLRGSGVRQLLESESVSLLEAVREQVETYTPGAMVDLKDATKKQKARAVGFVYPILKRYGDTLRAMQCVVSSPGGGSGWVVSIVFPGSHPRSGVPFDRIVQAHVRGEGHNPKRDFLKLPPGWSPRFLDRLSSAVRSIS